MKPKKILLVGSDQVWSIERIYLKYLRQLNKDAELFAAQNIFYDYYKTSLFNKIKFKAGISNIYQQINRQLLAKIEEYKPDIVWVFKGMEIFPETIALLKKKSILTANYNPDNPFLFSGRGSGNSNVTKSIALYDLHLTYNLSVKKKIEDEYHKRTEFLPFGFELSEALYNSSAAEKEISGICFLGNPDSGRAEFIRGLADAGLKVDVYGHGWPNFLQHEKIKNFDAVYGDDFWRTLRRYRVQLNLMRPHNENGHNMRSFEVPGVGGIMLAPDTVEHRLFFNDGEEVFLFSSIEDCVEKAKKILAMQEKESWIIRHHARQRSIDSKYTYKDRAAQALGYFEKIYA